MIRRYVVREQSRSPVDGLLLACLFEDDGR